MSFCFAVPPHHSFLTRNATLARLGTQPLRPLLPPLLGFAPRVSPSSWPCRRPHAPCFLPPPPPVWMCKQIFTMEGLAHSSAFSASPPALLSSSSLGAGPTPALERAVARGLDRRCLDVRGTQPPALPSSKMLAPICRRTIQSVSNLPSSRLARRRYRRRICHYPFTLLCKPIGSVSK